MKKLGLVFQMPGIVLGILFLVGGVVSAVWLLIIGQWENVALGIGAAFVDHLVIGILLFPMLLLTAAAGGMIRNHNAVASIVVAVIAQLYIGSVVAAWCFGVLWYFTKGVSTTALIPTLIWSYAVAIGPWMYLASKDADSQAGNNLYSTVTTMAAGSAYVVNMVIILLGHGSVRAILGVFGIAILLATVVNSAIEYSTFKLENNLSIESDDISNTTEWR